MAAAWSVEAAWSVAAAKAASTAYIYIYAVNTHMYAYCVSSFHIKKDFSGPGAGGRSYPVNVTAREPC
jgi:hypothetical protein